MYRVVAAGCIFIYVVFAPVCFGGVLVGEGEHQGPHPSIKAVPLLSENFNFSYSEQVDPSLPHHEGAVCHGANCVGAEISKIFEHVDMYDHVTTIEVANALILLLSTIFLCVAPAFTRYFLSAIRSVPVLPAYLFQDNAFLLKKKLRHWMVRYMRSPSQIMLVT